MSGIFSCSPMPRPTETMTGAAVRSTVWADSRKGSLGRLRICAASSCGDEGLDGARLRFRFEDCVGAEGSSLDGDEARAGLAAGAIVGVELALEELADEDRALRGIVGVDGDDVRDEDLAEAGGERGREVADLIGVREDDECGVRVLDELLEREDECRPRCRVRAGRDRRCRPCRAVWWRVRRRAALWLAPRTAAEQVAPSLAASCWPAARASKLMRFQLPARCSRTTRTPAPLISLSPQTSVFQRVARRFRRACR